MLNFSRSKTENQGLSDVSDLKYGFWRFCVGQTISSKIPILDFFEKVIFVIFILDQETILNWSNRIFIKFFGKFSK